MLLICAEIHLVEDNISGTRTHAQLNHVHQFHQQLNLPQVHRPLVIALQRVYTYLVLYVHTGLSNFDGLTLMRGTHTASQHVCTAVLRGKNKDPTRKNVPTAAPRGRFRYGLPPTWKTSQSIMCTRYPTRHKTQGQRQQSAPCVAASNVSSTDKARRVSATAGYE